MCPPGVDQTMRTSQTWHIAAPDIKQIHLLGSKAEDYGKTSLTEAVFNEEPLFNAWDMVATPVIPRLMPIKSLLNSGHSIAKKQTATSAFDKLSTEILDMIINEVESDKKDLISLGLTCSSLWDIVIARIYKQARRTAAPFANTRLIFQGNYTVNLPPSFEDEPEQKEARERFSIRRYGMCPARHFFWNQHYDTQPVGLSQTFAELSEALEEFAKNDVVPARALKHMKLQLDATRFFPQDQEWILRNLTKKEFITSAVLSKKPNPFGLRFPGKTQPFKFEDVFMSQIAWSRLDGGKDMKEMNRWGFNYKIGTWAGDCCDLVTADVHQLSADGEEWIDVGEAAIRDAALFRQIVMSRKAHGGD